MTWSPAGCPCSTHNSPKIETQPPLNTIRRLRRDLGVDWIEIKPGHYQHQRKP